MKKALIFAVSLTAYLSNANLTDPVPTNIQMSDQVPQVQNNPISTQDATMQQDVMNVPQDGTILINTPTQPQPQDGTILLPQNNPKFGQKRQKTNQQGKVERKTKEAKNQQVWRDTRQQHLESQQSGSTISDKTGVQAGTKTGKKSTFQYKRKEDSESEKQQDNQNRGRWNGVGEKNFGNDKNKKQKWSNTQASQVQTNQLKGKGQKGKPQWSYQNVVPAGKIPVNQGPVSQGPVNQNGQNVRPEGPQNWQGQQMRQEQAQNNQFGQNQERRPEWGNGGQPQYQVRQNTQNVNQGFRK